MLDWLLNPNHAGLFAAQHTGAFARAGLKVKIVSPSDPDSPSRLVAAGQVDLAVGYGAEINMIVSAGLPLARIASLIDRPLNTIIALGGIKTLADLRGKTIGYSVAGVEEAVLDVMLGSAGLKRDGFTAVKVNYDMVAALLSRRLDAATGAYRNAELIQLRQMGRDPAVFLPEEHGVPMYDELILIVQRARLGDARLSRFIAALRDGVAALQKDPDGLFRAFADAHSELDTPYTKASWQATMPLLARDPGQLDEARYRTFQDFCVTQGIIPKPLPVDQFAVQLVA
nr:ABC transporter substrate-binding protein [uncultured Lichenicoccus sp.]